MAAIEANVRGGDTISAIRRYREETGAGLADAKAAVDAIVRAEGAPSGWAGVPKQSAVVLAVLGTILIVLAVVGVTGTLSHHAP